MGEIHGNGEGEVPSFLGTLGRLLGTDHPVDLIDEQNFSRQRNRNGHPKRMVNQNLLGAVN